jgi:GxxExxY protein
MCHPSSFISPRPFCFMLTNDEQLTEIIIVDPKVITAFNESHLSQMLGYLNITGLKTALLLNFKYARLQIKRVSN